MSAAAGRPGRVFLVGAGPGDPELITVRGLRCLRQADVVVYDRLVHPQLLTEAPEWAERIYAGKAPGAHYRGQDEINALLVARARSGFTVVRLKGGDPFVFGRGGEEAATLGAAGIPWEVVPAVSSAVGVPARAGIPVTHRGVAASFAVVTAHRAADAEDGLDWQALAAMDTLVVLMGVSALASVVAVLQRWGRSPATPVAIIERGTLHDERVTRGTLATIVRRAAATGVRAPATIVIGAVVALREQLQGVIDPLTAPTPLLGSEAEPAPTHPFGSPIDVH